MGRRPDARTLLFERIRSSPKKFVHLLGVPYAATLEEHGDPEHVDHLWLTLEVPPFGRIRVCVNTLSRLNKNAGFEPRVRIGILRSEYTERPTPMLEECPGMDYETWEKQGAVLYEFYEHAAAAELLLPRMRRAVRAEVWGELYARDHLGIHQTHSRRASCAVAQDLRNRDGAFRLYYADLTAELFLCKFCGQP